MATTTVVHFGVEIIFSHCRNELITTQCDKALYDEEGEAKIKEEEMQELGEKWGKWGEWGARPISYRYLVKKEGVCGRRLSALALLDSKN